MPSAAVRRLSFPLKPSLNGAVRVLVLKKRSRPALRDANSSDDGLGIGASLCALAGSGEGGYVEYKKVQKKPPRPD